MTPKKNEGTRLIVVLLVVALAALWLTGCATIRVEAEHVSHPMAGWPTGPASEESQLTQLNGLLEWKRNGWYLTTGLGWKLYEKNQREFVGPSLTGTVRVGYELVLR